MASSSRSRMPHKRHTFFDDSFLSEIGGRLKFGGRNLEEMIAEVPMPEPKPWVLPEHPMDKDGAAFGLKGFEYKTLIDEGFRLARHDPMVKEAFRRFLQATKLKSEKVLKDVYEREVRQAKAQADRESRMEQKLRNRKAKIDSIEKSWSAVRSTVRTRWRKIIKSLAALLEQDAFLETMADRDQALVGWLADRGIVEMEDQRVKRVAWAKLEDFSIEEIQELILFLNAHGSGGFIRPTKKEAEEAA